MKNEINLVDFKGAELTILEGKAKNPVEPVALKIEGTIESPARWLEKKLTAMAVIDCMVLVNREARTMILTVNEKLPTADTIKGSIEFHEDFLKFKINSGEQISSFELAELIKMNRSCFKDKAVAMKLVKDLRTFKAKVDKDIEAFKDDRANYSIKKNQAVESNLPDSFWLNIPVFKGQPKESIEVEININPDNLSCTLVSPSANDFIADFKDKIIDEQIKKIEGLSPELCIIES